jgi:CheY-like chemotaxis protein
MSEQDRNAAGPASGRGTIRLLIVDDQPVVRDGLSGVLESSPESSRWWGRPATGRGGDPAVALQPEVVLMKLRMPGTDGVSAITRLSERGVTARVLVLTTCDTDGDVIPAIEAGVTGYLLKDCPAANCCGPCGPPRAARRRCPRRWRPGCSARSARRPGNRSATGNWTCSPSSPGEARTGTSRPGCSLARRRSRPHLHICAKLGVNDRRPRSGSASSGACCRARSTERPAFSPGPDLGNLRQRGHLDAVSSARLLS